MIEPQVKFRDELDAIARRINGTYIAAAATKQSGEQSFVAVSPRAHDREGRLGAAVPDEKALPGASTTVVRTVDLAALMLERLPSGTLSITKLDVEGHEYELLPWLLAHGALCRTRYLLQEWHLNTVPPQRRLAGLGLRLSFHSLLEHGCATPPAAVYHDEFTPNNFGMAVPGLSRVAAERSKWAGRSKGGIDTHSFVSRHESNDMHLLWTERDAPLPCPEPRCEGSCRMERMACNRTMLLRAYSSAASHRSPVAANGVLLSVQHAHKTARFSEDVATPGCECVRSKAFATLRELSRRRYYSPPPSLAPRACDSNRSAGAGAGAGAAGLSHWP